MTGIGPLAVRCPRVRDRVGQGPKRIRFRRRFCPPRPATSRRRSVSKDAGGLSASTIGRPKEVWSEEHTRWSKRDLSAKQYVYFWVDGIHLQARLEDAAQCLFIIGATPEGKQELVGLTDGVREVHNPRRSSASP
jgi:putative transposase